MKIPTLLGLFILLIMLTGFVIGALYLQKMFHPIHSTKLYQVQITNISPSSATVSWFSTIPIETKAQLNGNTNGVNTIVGDDRDNVNPTKRYTHITTFKNLVPGENYTVSLFDDKNNIYSPLPHFQTLLHVNQNQKTATFIGSVVDKNFLPITDALAIYQHGNNSTIVGLNQDGSYLLNVILPSVPTVQLTITDGHLTSEIKVPTNDQNSPIPAVVLGQNLDLGDYSKSASSSSTLNDTASNSAQKNLTSLTKKNPNTK